MKLKARNQQRKSTKPKADSLEDINKTDKPLTRLTKKKREDTNYFNRNERGLHYRSLSYVCSFFLVP